MSHSFFTLCFSVEHWETLAESGSPNASELLLGETIEKNCIKKLLISQQHLSADQNFVL